MSAISTAPVPQVLSSISSRQPSRFLCWFGSAATAFATLTVSAFVSSTLMAQDAEQTNQSGHRVALIDVAYIFKNLPAIKAHVGKVKADLKEEELKLKRRRDALKQAAQQLESLKVGSADYANQEDYVARLDLQLRSHRVHKYRELSEAEARLYYDSYQLILAASKSVATNNHIHLMLNFDSAETDPERNDSVDRYVTKNVIFHDSTINMTNTVMKYLEQQINATQTENDGKVSSVSTH